MQEFINFKFWIPICHFTLSHVMEKKIINKKKERKKRLHYDKDMKVQWIQRRCRFKCRHSSQRLEFNGSSLEIKQRGLSTKDGSKKDGNTNEVGIRSAYTPHLWSCGNMLELLLLIFQGKKANFDERKHSWHPANLKVEVEIYRLTHCQDH
ncbi:uncharacterized protein [Nicotiana tomentosiformis]|uniref:uncharacterized protein isoform X2 n=1 Tax=Nicotiana tomentosiformis TaxID=4098 RepID=UPI001447F9AD|nr:uncharacterized protein LOC108945506 isoform X2 [Nicotiana tomentosiformis]